MNRHFEEFYDILVLDRKNSAFSKSMTLAKKYERLRGEIDEIKEALEKNDIKNLKEELGDSLWDLFGMMIIAEEKGLFTPEEIVSASMEKIRRRKPWIFHANNFTMDEELNMWAEAKKKEKAERTNAKKR